MIQLFLKLEDAVNIAEELVKNGNEDREIIENELMQKCYISDNQYSIGFHDGLKTAKDMIEKRMGE